MTARDATPFVPSTTDLAELARAAASCRGCDLYRDATQTVFGTGPSGPRVLMVGEQPGDQEDKAGQPFVGPAGRVLDQALVEVGIDRVEVYLTNAVKHFKFVRPERGKRRIHKTPSRTEVVACRPWLLAEFAAVQPRFLVLLGSVAAKAVLGPSFKLTEHRGELLEPPDSMPQAKVLVTTHPSAVLRAPNRAEAFQAMVTDLRVLAQALVRV
jgi:DNA polymerase